MLHFSGPESGYVSYLQQKADINKGRTITNLPIASINVRFL